MSTGIFNLPTPYNEPVRDYAPGSPERASLKQRLSELDGQQIEIPMIIGGKEVRTGTTAKAVKPHDQAPRAGGVPQGRRRARSSRRSRRPSDAHASGRARPWDERAAVFLRAADLLAGPWRDTINAATMLGQSKTVYQAEIDAACELADFWRFNPTYMRRIMEEQPRSSPGHLEPDGVPAAGGLRVRGRPVQLHGHRRQPVRRRPR